MLTIQDNVSNIHRAYGFGYLNSAMGVAFGGGAGALAEARFTQG